MSGLEGGILSEKYRSRLGMAAVGVLALVPLFQGILYSEFVVSLLITVLIWALFAMSLDVILGYAGLISLGQAMFYGLGSYTVMLVLMHLTPSAFVAIFVAIAISAVAAWIVGYLAIRVSGVYFVMITLAFAEVFSQFVTNMDFTGGSNGLFGGPDPLYGIAGVGVNFQEMELGAGPFLFTGDTLFYYFLLAVVVLSFLVVRRIMSAPFGSVLQSVRESELRARFIGYDVQSFKRQSFVLSGILAGLAGAMFGLYNGFAAPAQLHWIVSGDVIVMAVLGGSGTLYGPMIGAATFTILQDQLSSIISWWRLLLGLIFVAIVLFLPKGIISLPSRLSELANGRAEDIAFGDQSDTEVEN